MIKIRSFFLFIIPFFIYGCVPIDPQNGDGQGTDQGIKVKVVEKDLVTEDYIYEPQVKTALLYPFTYNNDSNDIYSPPMLRPAIIPIAQTNQLILEFDEMGNYPQSYYAKILNCNADWTVSSLSSVQYVNEFNEYFISDRKSSFNTRLPYIHYKFVVPRVKQSGNYMVIVYRNFNDKDLILSKRFMVYDNQIDILPQVKFSTVLDTRNFNQQVDFAISYAKYDIFNPLQNLKVSVRQNYRYATAINNLKPVFIKEDEKRLEYFTYDLTNNFQGGNEFRIFDIRSAMFAGFNVAKVRRDSAKAEEYLRVDRNRRNDGYALTIDKNGRFYIQLYETGGTDIDPDYVYVNMYLRSDKTDGKVYAFGAFTDWKLKDDFEMSYDETNKYYTCRALLKQGYYNYRYVYVPPGTTKIDETYFEGTYNLTENEYDIVAYYRPVGARSDLIIGYKYVKYP
ncbi:MAG TPA: DUF5103 domain-containing protein [Cytophagaceae bacterium]|jgi:hypothetical protein|nr:DUF5103 domain-containing protein [Cytophagaceae bacterium]